MAALTGVKILRFLYHKHLAGYTVAEDPHFDVEARAAFYDLLARTRRYLEFGAGGSTLAAARLGVETLSVESDARYARAVRRRLPPGAPCRVIEADIGATGEWGFPLWQRPTPQRLLRWRRYIELPFELLGGGPDGFPDLVLVDGRFRRACALETARQARAAGKTTILFFDDYADRPYYHDIERHLGAPRMSGRAAVFHVGRGPHIAASAVTEAVADCR